MSKEVYDMPLQHSTKLRTMTPHSPIQLNDLGKTPINTMNTNEQLVYTQSADRNYDLPCQRQGDDYLFDSYVENRPAIIKNPYYQEANKYSIGPQRQTEEVSKTAVVERKSINSVRGRVCSVYEKLLQQNKKKQKQNNHVLTQTTFNPKQLKSQITHISHHQSAENITLKQNTHITTSSKTKQNTNKTKQKKIIINNPKKLDFINTNIKTKYQQILQEYFHPKHHPQKKKQQYLSIQELRLSKIYGKNSVILKLKQKLSVPFLVNVDYQSKKGKDKGMINNQMGRDTQRNYRIAGKIKQEYYKNNNDKSKENKNRKNCQGNQIQPKKQNIDGQYKNIPSQRWMSMNFHERQQRILSNRKQKELIGKQKNIEKQIKSCTFKPQLTNKSKSLKTIPYQKQSYLQLHYDKLHRKY